MPDREPRYFYQFPSPTRHRTMAFWYKVLIDSEGWTDSLIDAYRNVSGKEGKMFRKRMLSELRQRRKVRRALFGETPLEHLVRTGKTISITHLLSQTARATRRK